MHFWDQSTGMDVRFYPAAAGSSLPGDPSNLDFAQCLGYYSYNKVIIPAVVNCPRPAGPGMLWGLPAVGRARGAAGTLPGAPLGCGARPRPAGNFGVPQPGGHGQGLPEPGIARLVPGCHPGPAEPRRSLGDPGRDRRGRLPPLRTSG